ADQSGTQICHAIGFGVALLLGVGLPALVDDGDVECGDAGAIADEARAVEGRPDAQEEAVALFTMHAAKGLEWPVVIPINTMTGV
ncbi:hypothetical protein BSZ19_00025, partial [Bradyrhizobium japonicum]